MVGAGSSASRHGRALLAKARSSADVPGQHPEALGTGTCSSCGAPMDVFRPRYPNGLSAEVGMVWCLTRGRDGAWSCSRAVMPSARAALLLLILDEQQPSSIALRERRELLDVRCI